MDYSMRECGADMAMADDMSVVLGFGMAFLGGGHRAVPSRGTMTKVRLVLLLVVVPIGIWIFRHVLTKMSWSGFRVVSVAVKNDRQTGSD
jgi:hypothetical protein